MRLLYSRRRQCCAVSLWVWAGSGPRVPLFLYHCIPLLFFSITFAFSLYITRYFASFLVSFLRFFFFLPGNSAFFCSLLLFVYMLYIYIYIWFLFFQGFIPLFPIQKGSTRASFDLASFVLFCFLQSRLPSFLFFFFVTVLWVLGCTSSPTSSEKKKKKERHARLGRGWGQRVIRQSCPFLFALKFSPVFLYLSPYLQLLNCIRSNSWQLSAPEWKSLILEKAKRKTLLTSLSSVAFLVKCDVCTSLCRHTHTHTHALYFWLAWASFYFFSACASVRTARWTSSSQYFILTLSCGSTMFP